jgi:aryl-alcohol dehydrogenase-like predicted oxidoreductase
MLQYCQQHNIKLMSYGSAAGGLLSDRYVEEPKKGLFGERGQLRELRCLMCLVGGRMRVVVKV